MLTTKYEFKRSALAMMVGLATSGALADEKVGAQENYDAALEEVTVYGTRQSLSDALNNKRDADTQVDVISAEDIGKMPDADIGDSLQRVTGVQVQRGENGVAREVNIRGLPGNFSRVLYNGRAITTSIDNNRNFSFQIMPSSFVSRTVVHKAASADLLEGGIAGTIDMRSHRAFDIGKQTVRFSAEGDYLGNNGEVGPDMTALYSNLFAGDTVGFTVGVNYLEQNIANQINTSAHPTTAFKESPAAGRDFNGDGDTLDTVYGPAQVRFEYHDSTRERHAAFANLEWRPSDNLKLFGELFHTRYDSAENRSRLMFLPNPTVDPVASDQVAISMGGNEYWQKLHGTNIKATVDSSPISRESDVSVFTFDTEYKTGLWTIDAGVNVASSKTDWVSVLAKANLPASGFDTTLDGTRDGPWGVNFADRDAAATVFLDPNSYSAFSVNAVQLGSELENNSTAYNLDVQREFDLNLAGGFNINGMKFGVHYSEDESLAIQPSATLNPAQLANLGIEFALDKVDVGRGEWFDGAAGGYSNPLPWLTPSVDKLMDSYSVSDLKAAAEALGTYQPGFRDDVTEDIFSTYARIDFNAVDGDLSGNFGVRYVQTEQYASGKGADLKDGILDDGSGNLSLPVSDLITRSRSYGEVLPSLNARYSLAEDHVLRFGAARTMSRPQKEDLSVTTGFNPATMTVISADPDLEPFISDNVDLSYGWYFAPESLVSVALFYKDLKSLVQLQELPEQMFAITDTATGETRQEAFTLRGQSNAEGVILQGYELSYQQPFTFLPGFLANTGVNLNYTYIDNSEPELLAAASEDNFNAIFYYSGDKLDARLAYTYRGDYLQFPAEELLPSRSFDAFEYMTASMSYKISPQVIANFAFSNVTDEGTYVFNGNGTPRAFSDFGQRYTAGITLRF